MTALAFLIACEVATSPSPAVAPAPDVAPPSLPVAAAEVDADPKSTRVISVSEIHPVPADVAAVSAETPKAANAALRAVAAPMPPVVVDTLAAPESPPPVAAEAAPTVATSIPSGPVDYVFDAARSSLYVVVRYDRSSTLGPSIGHDHVVAATDATGRVRWNEADPGLCEVRLDVPVSGLVVDPPGSRSRAGLEGTPPVADQPKIVENLQGKKQLDLSAYPTISYRSTSCSGSAGRYDVRGALTMHGTEKAISLPMKIAVDDGRFVAHGTFDARHTDFGFDPFSAVMGALRNDDGLSFVVDVVAPKAP